MKPVSKSVWMGLGITCLGAVLVCLTLPFFKAKIGGTVYPMVEISFQASKTGEDPFALEFWGWIENEDQEGKGQWIPAYYDGENVWKIRFSPRSKGRYQARIYSEVKGIRKATDMGTLSPESFEVKEKASGSGLVRIDPKNPRTFTREDGASYYPVGINIGWDMGEQGDVVAFLERLAAAGGNWSRIWMCHWDDKNLDWPQNKKLPPGELDPDAALKWDRIVAAADRVGIPFQMVLQHHGQVSTWVNPMWDQNPWNKKNGGFLERAEDFFTDPQARELTKRKYRYIVARYGYSPSVMAWELFNEVEFTDAGKTTEGREAIRLWHQEMAGYIRSIDPYQHLITTSSPSLSDSVWVTMDYVQQHAYPPDPLIGSGGFSVDVLSLSKPVFYGEIGSTGDGGRTDRDGGRVLRDVLWGSLFSGSAGSAQYWAWDQVDREKLYPLIQGLSGFSQRAGLGGGGWRSLYAKVSTLGRVDLVFGPGQRWESVVDPRLVLRGDGAGRGEGVRFSSTLRPRRGSGEKEGTDTASFFVEMNEPGRWEVTVNEVSKDGARVELQADGQVLFSHAWEAVTDPARAGELPMVLGADVPGGTRELKIKSNGADYFQVSSIRLKKYASELGVRAMTNDQHVVLWIYHEEALSRGPLSDGVISAPSGNVRLEGLLDGTYRMRCWETTKTSLLSENKINVSGGVLEFATPSFVSDVAVLLTRVKD